MTSARTHTLKSAADSAAKSRMSKSSKPGHHPLPCEKPGHKGGAKHLMDPCDIDSLALTLVHGEKTENITLTAQRRHEPVSAKAYTAYRSRLANVDLIVEALSDTEDTRTGLLDKDMPEALSVQLIATDSASHKNPTPAPHPHTSLIGGVKNVSTEAGKPISEEIWAQAPGSFVGGILARCWPFGSGASDIYMLRGESCGIVSGKPIHDLAIGLVVMPSDEWVITLGLGTYRGAGFEGTTGTTSDGGSLKSQTTTSYTKTAKGLTTTDETKVQDGGDDFETKYTVQKANAFLRTPVLSESDSTEQSKPTFDVYSAIPKVKIEHTYGGRKSELDVSGIINEILKAKNCLDKILDLLWSVKLGWSLSADYTFLQGQLQLAWGRNWPTEFSEEDRVYYIERYIKLSGAVKIIDAKVHGMGGLEVNFTLGSMVAEIYVDLGLELTLSAGGQLVCTNPESASEAQLTGSVDGDVTLELGGKAGGRICGAGLQARLAVQGELTLSGEAVTAGFRKPINFTSTCRSDDVELVGEVTWTGATPRDLCAIDPIIIIRAHDIWNKEAIL